MTEDKKLKQAFIAFAVLQTIAALCSFGEIIIQSTSWCAESEDEHSKKGYHVCPTLGPYGTGLWSLPFVVACMVLIRRGSIRHIEPIIGLISISLLSAIVAAGAIIFQVIIIQKTFESDFTSVGTILFTLCAMNVLSLTGLLGTSVCAMFYASKMSCGGYAPIMQNQYATTGSLSGVSIVIG